jgi:broad specificity phosphatase PhoE
MQVMGRLLLVRHGQASFGAEDYDQLSELGHRQCRRLGDYLRERNWAFEAVLTGTLRRHRQSWEAIARGLGNTQAALALPGLDEYDSLAVIATVHPTPLTRPTNYAEYRHHFRLLRDGLRLWMDGQSQPQGMPTYRVFVEGVAAALELVRERYQGDVLVVSSGGPISTAVGLLLSTPPQVTIDLNMRIRNSAVTELTFNSKRHNLVTYNTLPHLDGSEWQDWITHA